ncbi:MAG: hypothetical protein ABJB09_01860 [Verrucomicrobiota bacterium]
MRRLLAFSSLLYLFIGRNISAQEAVEHDVVVQASAEEFEDPGGYGQPQWAERSRASSTTKLYVLSPYEVFIGILSESRFRHGQSVHELSQEIEMGLPNRFELGLENHLGIAGGDIAEKTVELTARYAFARWGAIPLNPAVSVGYEFGVDRLPSLGRTSDAYEMRLLVGQEFFPRIQWAANGFFRHEVGGDRSREIGFTQAISYVTIADRLEIGTEMRYTHASVETRLKGSLDEFIIGPSISWKPNRHTVIELAPLVGCTSESPRLALFATVSFEFGGAESSEHAVKGR